MIENVNSDEQEDDPHHESKDTKHHHEGFRSVKDDTWEQIKYDQLKKNRMKRYKMYAFEEKITLFKSNCVFLYQDDQI